MQSQNDSPHKNKFEAVDTLKLFFQDVADIPILSGYVDYLPLTRRIERGRHIAASPDNETALDETKKVIQQAINRLNTLLGSKVVTDIDPAEWGDIDYFLDDVTLKQPVAIDSLLSANETHHAIEEIREAVWALCYMFSVLPSLMRCNWQDLSLTSEINNRFTKIRDEVKQCKHDLTQGTLRYAINIARLYLNTPVPFEDILQQGMIGLMYAAEKYKESRMTHFQHYSSNWIRQQITRYISDHSRLIRIPVHLNDEVNKINKFVDEYTEINRYIPDELDIFSEVGWINQEDAELLKSTPEDKRYQEIQQRMRDLETLISGSNLPSKRISQQEAKLLNEINNIISNYKSYLKKAPSNEIIAQMIGWISEEDLKFFSKYKLLINQKNYKEVRQRLNKARDRYKYYEIANAKHYSLETEVIRIKENNYKLSGILPFQVDIISIIEVKILSDNLNLLMKRYLKPRQIEILQRRYGLLDGVSYTLEEIGTELGVTRERIRQIEYQALNILRQKKHLLEDFLISHNYYPSNLNEQLRRQVLSYLNTLDYQSYEDDYFYYVKKYVKNLIKNYVKRSHPKRLFSNIPRYVYIEKVLQEAGTPLHHKEIYQRVLTMLPPDTNFTEKNHYGALFYGDKFYGLGNGIFALSSWMETNQIAQSDKRITHFPEPLYPIKSSSSAFFESIMVGRNLLQKQSLTAYKFWEEMLIWAGRDERNMIRIQSAFDAWYAAGLINHIDYQIQSNQSVILTLDTDANMNAIRMMCLNNIAVRVAKIPELLLILKKIAPVSLLDIQKVLFGSIGAGYDVPIRLDVLAAFEAVQQDGNLWRITPIGEQILEANLPQELPDFSIIEEAAKEVSGDTMDLWEDELGLLD